LLAARAWWFMVILTGPLVGLSFISAVHTYAEVSAGAGAGCGVVCDPLVGIWAPTFSAYELIAIFMLPFVAIRLVSGDEQSGAAAIEKQRPFPAIGRVGVKFGVLLGGWLVANLAAMLAMGLWLLYGGHIAAREVGVVAVGQLLNAGLAAALGLATASIATHPSTAAILTLTVTVGSWVVEFVAAIHGGLWDRVAAATPGAIVERFDRGLVEVSALLIAATVIGASLAVAALWTRTGISVARRAMQAAVVTALACGLVVAATGVRGSWDASLSRQNSFAEPDEELLEHMTAPLAIEAHLSPEDPRRIQLEQSAFAKLRRVMPHVSVAFVSRTTSGLYEQADPGYGEVWYAMNGKRVMGRSATDEGVLETVFALAGTTPDDDADEAFRGQRLVATPVGAPILFYGLWPAAVAGAGIWVLRRQV
jgi:ABC-2 type transport system permease protein